MLNNPKNANSDVPRLSIQNENVSILIVVQQNYFWAKFKHISIQLFSQNILGWFWLYTNTRAKDPAKNSVDETSLW